MNPLRRIVNPAALPILPIALAMLLTVTPWMSAAARAQSLREAGKAAAEAQTKSCAAQAQESLKECEEEEAEKNDDGLPDRTGLGWTGIGLASAGNRGHCQNLERAYGISGGTLLATGLTFLVIDETRRYRKRSPARQTVVDIGPRSIQVRMLF
jgi:hypothetical protein